MIEQIVSRKNLLKARREVEKNKGSSGVDRMSVSQLKHHLELNRDAILTNILNDSYVPQPILGVERGRQNPPARSTYGHRSDVTTGGKPGDSPKVRVGVQRP